MYATVQDSVQVQKLQKSIVSVRNVLKAQFLLVSCDEFCLSHRI